MKTPAEKCAAKLNSGGLLIPIRASFKKPQLEQVTAIIQSEYAETIQSFTDQREAAWSSRDRFCNHINNIAKIVGMKVENAAPDAVERHVAETFKVAREAIMAANNQIVSMCYPTCRCGANTACDEPHTTDCQIIPLLAQLRTAMELMSK